MNTKTNRILSVALVLVMCFALMASAAFAADTESKVAPITLKVSAVGASSDMTITVKATVAMTEKQAEAAAALGTEALAAERFVCTLKDDAGFIAANEELVKTALISISADSLFERVSNEVKDGAINVVYALKKDAFAKDAKAADIKAALLADKTEISAVVEKAAIKEDLKATVTGTVTSDKNLLAQGETVVSLSAKMPFVDVPSDRYFAEPVVWAVENKITNGKTETTFVPADNCTRGEFVTFLWRMSGEPKAEKTENPFTDVAENRFFYNAVLWAVENGITKGTSETTFSPDAPCTRGQLVTFLWRIDGEKKMDKVENPFTDVAQGRFFYDAVLWAVENGVTNGMTETTFEPDTNCNRGMVVTFLFRNSSTAEQTAA